LKTKKSQIAFGVVTRPYEYFANEPDPSRKHVIGAEWRRVDVPRTAVKQDLLNTLGSALTIFQSRRNDAQWRLLQIMENGTDPGAKAENLILPNDGEDDASSDLATPDLEEYGLNRIQTLLRIERLGCKGRPKNTVRGGVHQTLIKLNGSIFPTPNMFL